MDARTLPDLEPLDSKALKSLILELHDQVFSNQQEILSQREQLASRDAEIEHLKLLIAKLRRMQFGRSSEKLDRQIEPRDAGIQIDKFRAQSRRGPLAPAPRQAAPPRRQGRQFR